MQTTSNLQQFRQLVYRVFTKRADMLMDLVDALTVARHVASPVAVSEEAPFRRKFSAVYDALKAGELDLPAVHTLLHEHQADEWARLAGYEVYAVDTTPDERPEAQTVPDLVLLKSQKNAPVRVGQKYSWLVRLVKPGTSWVAPWDVRRVAAESTDNQTAVEQVTALDRHGEAPKVVVGDSLYANQPFLRVFLTVKNIWGLVRLRQNLNLYEQPKPKPPGSRGAPRKHGPVFKMGQPSRPPDRTARFQFGKQEVLLRAWHKLHLRKLPTLVGVVLRVEFLKADGSPRYQRPLWLFWTGPENIALPDLCQMYLWRFAIEHAFRFLKQHLGLVNHRLTDNADIQRWMWVCALAYWQLLLMQPEVDAMTAPWYPRRKRSGELTWFTPGQVQRGASRFLLQLGTPAKAPRPAGKGLGRATGFRPTRRKRYKVVRKSKKPQKKASPTAIPSA